MLGLRFYAPGFELAISTGNNHEVGRFLRYPREPNLFDQCGVPSVKALS